MGTPIRLGLVGAGRAGWGMHCKELESRKDKFVFVAACDLLEERREKMAKQYGCKVYEKIEDLIADPEVEIVDIATRSCDHFAHAKMALEAGKDVWLEKPMCETYEQACILKELSSKPGGPRLFVRYNRRFEEDFMEIQRIIASGILGDVFEVHITRNSYSRRDDWQTLRQFGGGQMLNWGPHIIDQSLCLLESPIKEMRSDLKHTVAAGDCEDHLTIQFLGENGRTVLMQISGGVALPCPEYSVYGTKGSLEIWNKEMKLKYLDPSVALPDPVADPGTPGDSFGASGTFSSAVELNWVEETREAHPGTPTIIWDYLYESYREGKPFPISTDEAIRVIKVISDAKKGTPFEKPSYELN